MPLPKEFKKPENNVPPFKQLTPTELQMWIKKLLKNIELLESLGPQDQDADQKTPFSFTSQQGKTLVLPCAYDDDNESFMPHIGMLPLHSLISTLIEKRYLSQYPRIQAPLALMRGGRKHWGLLHIEKDSQENISITLYDSKSPASFLCIPCCCNRYDISFIRAALTQIQGSTFDRKFTGWQGTFDGIRCGHYVIATMQDLSNNLDPCTQSAPKESRLAGFVDATVEAREDDSLLRGKL